MLLQNLIHKSSKCKVLIKQRRKGFNSCYIDLMIEKDDFKFTKLDMEIG